MSTMLVDYILNYTERIIARSSDAGEIEIEVPTHSVENDVFESFDSLSARSRNTIRVDVSERIDEKRLSPSLAGTSLSTECPPEQSLLRGTRHPLQMSRDRFLPVECDPM